MTVEAKKYTREQVEALELAPGAGRGNLEGWVPNLESGESLHEALDKAADYRGDVTLTLKNGERFEAFIFNCQIGSTLADSYLQYFIPDASEKRKVSYAEIAHIEFSGRDRAAGKHWEEWVKNYNEKKAAGETNIALVPEALE
jgi:hypothetical protein